jgi:hypothetical protein
VIFDKVCSDSFVTMSFWYFALVVAFAGSGTFSLMNLARSFSSRMSAILYF